MAVDARRLQWPRDRERAAEALYDLKNQALRLRSGVVAAGLVAATSWFLGGLTIVVNAPMIALVLGVAIATSWPLPKSLAPGLHLSSRRGLQAGIVLLGATLSVSSLVSVGVTSLPIMGLTLAAATLAAYLCGRLLNLPRNIVLLVGSGTGICGASAIAAVASIIGAAEREVAYALSAIFFFNFVAIFTFPLVAHLLGLNAEAFGLWAGTAVNDTSSVVVVAYGFSAAAGHYAVIVKLARTTMILPLAALLSLRVAREKNRPRHSARVRSLARVVPWFIACFVLAAVIASTLGEPPQLRSQAARLSSAFITLALAAVGLSTPVRNVRQFGWRPILLGAIVWLSVAATSLVAIRL